MLSFYILAHDSLYNIEGAKELKYQMHGIKALAPRVILRALQ